MTKSLYFIVYSKLTSNALLHSRPLHSCCPRLCALIVSALNLASNEDHDLAHAGASFSIHILSSSVVSLPMTSFR